MTKVQCGVLGATGMVGQRFVQLLESHPIFKPVLLAASEKRKGEIYGGTVNWIMDTPLPEYSKHIRLTGLDPDTIADSGIRVVFSALPSEIAGPIESELASRGICVFSNAAAHRMDPHVPILIPEVNAEHLDILDFQDTPGKIVTNANCSTTGLVLGLAPLRELGIKRVMVTTYQALSGAGYPGISSLDILGNVVPFIRGEEEKIIEETRKILGAVEGSGIVDHPVEVLPSCARVPVANGHLESVVVEFEGSFTEETIVQAFGEFSVSDEVRSLHSAPEMPVVFIDEPDRPQPKYDLTAGNGMATTVGRLRVDGNYARFYLLSHNTIRGAAGGSILNAELV